MVLLQDLSEHLQIDDPEERQMISSVSWEQYEAVLADLGDSPIYHVTFLDGTLEIMSPSRRHEVRAENIGRLLEAYLERRFSWGKIGSHSPPQPPVFFEDIASFCELIFLPHELDCHALLPV